MRIKILWDVTLRSLVDSCQLLKRIYCLHIQRRRLSSTHSFTETRGASLKLYSNRSRCFRLGSKCFSCYNTKGKLIGNKGKKNIVKTHMQMKILPYFLPVLEEN
jgi:hypothetical protein